MEITPELERYLFSRLALMHGSEFATRLVKHVKFVSHYEGYGAPGHLDMTLILDLLDIVSSLRHLSESENENIK